MGDPVNSGRLIFISGWASDSSCWDSIVKKLDRPVSCRYVNWWECLNDTVEENALLQIFEKEKGDAIIVGWSLGALVALDGAAFGWDHVKALVLISGTSRMTSQGNYPGVDSRKLRAMHARFRRAPRQVFEEFARLSIDGGLDSRSETDEFIYKFVEQAERLNSENLTAGLQYLQKKDLRRILPEIGIPVYLIHGVGDKIIPLDCARYMQRALPDARLKEVQGEGHALLYTVPFLVAGFIRDAIDANFNSQ